ncbi:MAG: selenium metabolism-associated LysR family transcriptional regulator [Bacillota bacterium]
MLMHQLEVFVQVAEQKSFSKAAENLFLSQSTVSTHVSNFEKHLDRKLFDRLGRQVVLTTDGERLYPRAKEIIALKDKALWEMKDWSNKISGHLNLAASTVPAQYAMPFLLTKFLKNYPGIKFSLEQSSSEKVAEKLLKGKAELGMLGGQYHKEQLMFIPFAEEKLVLITPAGLKLNNQISISDLSGHPFLFRKADSGTQANLEKMLNKAGIALSQLRVIGYFDSLGTLKESVKEGLGISIISAIAAVDYVKNGFINAYELKELPKTRTFYFSYHRKRTLSPLAEAFINSSQELSTILLTKYKI